MRLGIDDLTDHRQTAHISHTPFDERRVGAAAVYCSDGRFGEQMDEFLHEGLKLPRYDRLAIPGGASCLAGHTCAYHKKHALERQLDFLIREHGLSRIVLIAHEGCAFYRDVWLGLRTTEQQQAADLEKAAAQIAAVHPHVQLQIYFARKVDGKVVFEQWSERGSAFWRRAGV